MTAATTTRTWWDAQPEPVRAVLDLANLADTLHAAIPALLPAYADTITAIGEELVWIDRLRADEPADVLAAYFGQRVSTLHPDQVAEQLADEKQADALCAAQLVVSLIAKAGAR